jgi:endonuclease/exonuclease/phosphatase family metal-dependent hydrolase
MRLPAAHRAFQRTLAFVLLVLAAGLAVAGDPGDLHVATYNLRLDVASDGANAWPHRRDAVKALVRRHGFDVFGTQEALPGQLADLDALTEYARVGVGRDDGKQAGEHSAIFYRRDRFELLAHGDFWFSQTPEVPSKGWDARCCNRLASWARLHDKASGKALTVVSVHFDHEGEVARRESAALLLRWLAGRDSGDALVALGDFNSGPETEQIRRMQAGDGRCAPALGSAAIRRTATVGPPGAVPSNAAMASRFLQRQADVVQAVQQAVLAEGVDLEAEWLHAIGQHDHLRRPGRRSARSPRSPRTDANSAFDLLIAIKNDRQQCPFLKQLLKKMSAKLGAITARKP